MTEAELSQFVQAIMQRGSPAYTTPSGAFLELLSKWASEQNLTAFAEACSLQSSLHPSTSAFVAARVPGILCNSYFTVRPNFNYEKFIQWSLQNEGWGKPLVDGYASPISLSKAVEAICVAINSGA